MSDSPALYHGLAGVCFYLMAHMVFMSYMFSKRHLYFSPNSIFLLMGMSTSTFIIKVYSVQSKEYEDFLQLFLENIPYLFPIIVATECLGQSKSIYAKKPFQILIVPLIVTIANISLSYYALKYFQQLIIKSSFHKLWTKEFNDTALLSVSTSLHLIDSKGFNFLFSDLQRDQLLNNLRSHSFLNFVISCFLTYTMKLTCKHGEEEPTSLHLFKVGFISVTVSILIGLSFALLSCLLIRMVQRYMNPFRMLILILCLLFTMAGICIVQDEYVSMVVALIIFSITNSHYLKYSMDVKTAFHLGFILRIFSMICEAIVVVIMSFAIPTELDRELFFKVGVFFGLLVITKLITQGLSYLALRLFMTRDLDNELTFTGFFAIFSASFMRGPLAFLISLFCASNDWRLYLPVQLSFFIQSVIFTPLARYCLKQMKPEAQIRVKKINFGVAGYPKARLSFFSILDFSVIKTMLISNHKNRELNESMNNFNEICLKQGNELSTKKLTQFVMNRQANSKLDTRNQTKKTHYGTSHFKSFLKKIDTHH